MVHKFAWRLWLGHKHGFSDCRQAIALGAQGSQSFRKQEQEDPNLLENCKKLFFARDVSGDDNVTLDAKLRHPGLKSTFIVLKSLLKPR